LFSLFEGAAQTPETSGCGIAAPGRMENAKISLEVPLRLSTKVWALSQNEGGSEFNAKRLPNVVYAETITSVGFGRVTERS
jgi:hypothetical protein